MPNLTIDHDRIIYGENTYPVRAITSVTTSKDVSKGATGCAVTLVFGMFFLFGLALVLYVLPKFGIPDNEAVRGIGTIIVLIVAIWGAQQANRQNIHSYYYIHLHMAGGEEATITNYTAEDHRKCLDAINHSLAG